MTTGMIIGAVVFWGVLIVFALMRPGRQEEYKQHLRDPNRRSRFF